MRKPRHPVDASLMAGWIDLDDVGGSGAPEGLLVRLAERYRCDRPAALDGDGDRALRPEDLLNGDLDLGDYESPTVLAFVAIFDPVCATAVAAAARLAPQTRARPRLLAVVAVVNRQSRHRDVRAVTAVLTELGPTRDALAVVRSLAEGAIAADRERAEAALCRYLNQVGCGGLVPDDPVGDILVFAHRLSLPGAILDRLLAAMVESARVALKTRVALVRGLDRLPKPLRLALVTRVARLPDGPESDCLKLVLAQTIDRRGPTPVAAPAGAGDAPWSPDWVVRGAGRSRRARVRTLRDVLHNQRARTGS